MRTVIAAASPRGDPAPVSQANLHHYTSSPKQQALHMA